MMSRVTVALHDVLSKPRQSEGKGQKSILAIVEHNSNAFVQLYGLEAVEVDFGNHTFTLSGGDALRVAAARARAEHMLREPLFVLRVNPKVVVGMRLLNESKKHFSQETGCWLHFAWAAHTVSCYGLNGPAAGRYIHAILAAVERCSAAFASGCPRGPDDPIVAEEGYDRRLKPLIKKYVNIIEAQTSAKLAIQNDDAEARCITVQFFGKPGEVAHAQRMVLEELEGMQLKELGLKAVGKQTGTLDQLLQDSCNPMTNGGLYPIVVSYASAAGAEPAPQMLLVPVRAGHGPGSPCPIPALGAGPPAAAMATAATQGWPATGPERLAEPRSLIPASSSGSSSSTSSCDGSLGPECISTSVSADFPGSTSSLGDTLPARHQSASIGDLCQLRRSATHAPCPPVISASWSAAAEPRRGPPPLPPHRHVAAVAGGGPRSWSHDDLHRALSALRRFDATHATHAPQPVQGLATSHSQEWPATRGCAVPSPAVGNTDRKADEQINDRVTAGGVGAPWVVALLREIEAGRLTPARLAEYFEWQAECPGGEGPDAPARDVERDMAYLMQ